MDTNKFVGSKIKEFRESRGWTQDQLADKLNTTRQTISRYESGSRKTNQDVLFDLSIIFNVKVDDFFPWQAQIDTTILWCRAVLCGLCVVKSVL